MKKYYLIILLLFISSNAYANCTHNGQIYPVGTIIGPLVCTSDGWQRR